MESSPAPQLKTGLFEQILQTNSGPQAGADQITPNWIGNARHGEVFRKSQAGPDILQCEGYRFIYQTIQYKRPILAVNLGGLGIDIYPVELCIGCDFWAGSLNHRKTAL